MKQAVGQHFLVIMLAVHRKALAESLARWPLPETADAFARRYVARHGVAQQLDAGDRGAAEAMVRDLAYWRLRLEFAGVGGLEAYAKALEQGILRG